MSSKKSEIIWILKRYSEERGRLKQQVGQRQSNPNLSEQGKQWDDLEIKDKNLRAQVQADILKILEDKRDKLYKPNTDKRLDQAYQLMLSNVLSILSVAGETMQDEDIVAAVEPFKEDSIALQGISSTMSKAGVPRDKIIRTIPKDIRAETLKRIESIMHNINHIDLDILGQPLSLAVGSYTPSELFGLDAVFKVLDDDLNYNPQI